MAESSVSHIIDHPADPIVLFKQLLHAAHAAQPDAIKLMNLATVDEEFGVLNRNVVYRGLSDDNCIIYVTQRFTRNYQNIRANAKCAISFLFPQLVLPTQDSKPNMWQVRLLGATAVELPECELDAWWAKELLSSKIRDIIFPCGQPVNYDDLKHKHDQFLNSHLASGEPLPRPSTFTAFKFRAQRWDFLMVGTHPIADRVQYRLQQNGQWESLHVST